MQIGASKGSDAEAHQPERKSVSATNKSKQSITMQEKLIQEVQMTASPESSLHEGGPKLPEPVCSSDSQGNEMDHPATESKGLDLSTLFSESTEIEAIYGRFMMIGHAGAGKTSLQLALMNKQLPPNLSSTPLATAKSVKCHWTYAGEEAGQYWKELSEDDEVMELAAFISKSMSPDALRQLIASLHNYTKDVASTSQIAPVINHTMVQQVLKKLMKEVLLKFTSESSAQPPNTKPSKSDVLLHLWDSGGQRVFLDILPAFLTSRTIFTLVFDASRDLNAKLQLSCRKEGNIIQTEHYHLSSVQLLLQWMASIHTQLRLRKPDGTPSYSPYPRILLVGTHRDELEKLSPSASEEVRLYLHSQYKGKAYAEMLMPQNPEMLVPQNPFFLVDNTTAGQDPAVKEIRERVHTFSSEHFVVKNVPSSWAFFRKILQNVSKQSTKSVMTYEEVTTVAQACSIEPEDVPHVLNFYHELGVLLYYVQVTGHRRKWVITDPQWLIKELAKVLSPTAFARQDHCVEHQWKLLCTHGILVEKLYRHVWGESAEELINLLQHFYLAAEVTNLSHTSTRRYKGKKYFVPCMLNVPSVTSSSKEEPVQRETSSQLEAPPESTSKGETGTTAQPHNQIPKPEEEPVQRETSSQLEAPPESTSKRETETTAQPWLCCCFIPKPEEEPVQRETSSQLEAPPESTSKGEPAAAGTTTQPPDQIPKPDPIYLVFDTEYVPPGYYIRLLASMAKVPDCKILLQGKQPNRYQVTFAYKVNNEVTMTENPHSIVTEVVAIGLNAISMSPDPSICSEIFQSLSTSISEVAEWLPSVEVLFAFNCKNQGCAIAEPHFVTIEGSPRSVFRCQNEKVCNLTTEQLHWFEHVQQEHSAPTMASLQQRFSATDQDLTVSSVIASLPSHVQDEWYSFGVALGVHQRTLDVIKADSSDDTSYALKRMLSSWMRAHGNPTWKEINRALKHIGEYTRSTHWDLWRVLQTQNHFIDFDLLFHQFRHICDDFLDDHYCHRYRHHHHRHHPFEYCRVCHRFVIILAESGVSVNDLKAVLEFSC